MGTLDISLKGHVLCSLMLPFYMHPPVEGEQGGDIIVIIWVRANSGMRHLF